MKSVLNINWKDWCRSWNSSMLATWCKELTHLKRPWFWARLKMGEGADREWGSWMASPTQWTWVSVNSSRWWWTGRPSMLLSMGLQTVGHNWVTELNWTELIGFPSHSWSHIPGGRKGAESSSPLNPHSSAFSFSVFHLMVIISGWWYTWAT